MNTATALLAFTYTIVILALILARLSFFKVKPGKARFSALLYDPIVLIHIGYTFYYIFEHTQGENPWTIILACTVYMTGLLLFLWGINTAKELNFAFGGFSGKIISSGPYRIMRHPFYVSYTLIWTTGTFLFNSPVLWITLIYLAAFYWSSAKSEEETILSSEMAREYESYCKETNMFIPRIKSWKNWNLKQ